MKPKPMYTGDMSKLDAEGRSLISRASDLQARSWNQRRQRELEIVFGAAKR